MSNDTTTGQAALYARAMQARHYVIGHTHAIEDPAAPIFCDGRVQTVPPGARLYFIDTTCESCTATTHIDLGDDARGIPNLVITAHERQCPAYWAMLATARRRPEHDGLAGIAVSGARA